VDGREVVLGGVVVGFDFGGAVQGVAACTTFDEGGDTKV